MDICLRFQSKRPGQAMILNPVDMIFNYKDEYDGDILIESLFGRHVSAASLGKANAGAGLNWMVSEVFFSCKCLPVLT